MVYWETYIETYLDIAIFEKHFWMKRFLIGTLIWEALILLKKVSFDDISK